MEGEWRFRGETEMDDGRCLFALESRQHFDGYLGKDRTFVWVYEAGWIQDGVLARVTGPVRQWEVA